MTFPTYQTPAPLEAYLRRATLGLPPERREEVWNELEEHVLNRVEQLEFQGHPPEEALEQALRELGPPLRVSAAMNGVHNMPKLIAFATLTTLAVSAGLYALAGGSGKIMMLPIETQGPAQKCVESTHKDQPNLPVISRNKNFICYQDDSQTEEGAYVSMTTAKQAVEALGGKITLHSNGEYKLTLAGGWTTLSLKFRRGQEPYVYAGRLLNSLLDLQPHTTEQQIILRGFQRPELTVGELTLKFNQDVKVPLGRNLYGEVASLAISQLVYLMSCIYAASERSAVWEGLNSSFLRCLAMSKWFSNHNGINRSLTSSAASTRVSFQAGFLALLIPARHC